MPLRFPDDPKHWRERAAEVRAVAHLMRDAVAKAMMLETAANYDKFAERVEERAKSAPS